MIEWPDFELPDEWALTRIDDLAIKLKAGGTPSRQDKGNFGGDIPFVLIDDMTSSGLYLRSTKETITRKGLESCSAWLVPENTVLLSMYATIGATVITTFPVATNQAILAIVPHESCDREYLSFCLQAHKRHLARLNVESTQKNINKGIVSSFPIPLPPLPEQKKIAHILSTVQRAIEAQERIIQTTTELKKALMHKLFTEGLRGEPQKQTEIGPVPESWEVKAVGELAAVKGGKRLPKGEKLVEQNTDLPYIRVTDFNEFSVNIDGLLFLTPDAQRKISRYIINKDDVFISIAGSIGIPGMIPPELDGANLTENAARLIPNNLAELHPRFLMYWLATDHCQAEIKAQTVKNAQPKLALARIKSLKIPLPPVEEQLEMAAALDLVGRKTENARAARMQLQDLFRTLLHELMTAKTRVHELQFVGLEVAL